MTGRMRFIFLVLIALSAALATAAIVVAVTTSSRPAGEKASAGGDFSLVDENGKPVTAADFKGRYRLMFFGFVRCPDVCPTTMLKIADALKDIPEVREKLTVILVSVDPERDTPEEMKNYVTYFDPSFRGLTGTPEQIAAMTKAYGVYVKKVPVEGSAMDYSVDHSGFLYLYGPDGDFITAYDPGLDIAALAARLKDAVR